MKKRIFSTLLALCMLLCLMPTAAFAEDSTEAPPVCSCETVCTTDNMNTECPVCGAENAIPQNCGQYIPVEDRTGENGSTEGADDPNGPIELSAADQVQAMIDGLPNAEEITEDNAEEVKAQLEAIDEAKAQLSDEETDELGMTRYAEAAAALGALAAPMLLANDSPDEQFFLTPGGRYYFDLSAMGIPGTANDALPDSNLHYVPFTYAGTVNAYKLTSATATTEEYAQQNKYAHSLFVADYAVTHTVSWDDLNTAGLIFGKDYVAGGVDYTLRAPSVGSGYTGSDDSERGTPQNNEWDAILDKANQDWKDNTSGYIKNWSDKYSFGQDNYADASRRAVRGYNSARLWDFRDATDSRPYVGFRPVLEVLNPDTLDSVGLKVVTLDLGGGKLGGSSDAIHIIVKNGSEFTAPASGGLTRPDGNTGSYFMWLGSDGKLYAPGANVPAEVTKLTAQFALSEQFFLTPGGTYYFDLSAMNIPGKVNGGLPDSTLHYVPFTYAGTIEAYKLTSEMATTEEYAQQNKYPHSLFIADYNVTHTVSRDDLNTKSLIFGKNYARGGVDYTLRAPSCGSGFTGSDDSERGTPQSNEWDAVLDKNSGYVKNWNDIYSWGQDTSSYESWYRAVRGYYSARGWGNYGAAYSYPNVGFRPVLEVLNPDELGSDGLKAVTLDLGGGKLGGSSDAIHIIVKTGSEFTAPASDGMTRPDGNTGSYFMWLGSNGKLYAPGASVPAEVTKLTAQFALSEQFSLKPGDTYYFDLSGEDIPGTANGGNSDGAVSLPDTSLHYVPFTYAGTVDAYKLTTAMETTEEYAQNNKYVHSLFVADYVVTNDVSWDTLNTANLIFGKDYASGGVDYTLRAPSVGSDSTGWDDSQRGMPQSNEWDTMLNKDSGYIQNWNGMFSWGQDVSSDGALLRAVRGNHSARFWGYFSSSGRNVSLGFRPVLEVLNPGSLGSGGLKVVTLDLGGGTLGGSSDAIQIIVKNGSKFTAPASNGLTRPAGNTGSYFMWLDDNGNSYAPGASVPADVTELTVQWTAPTYAVTLNAGDGTINSGNVTSYTYGVGATLPTDVTRTGYTFKGWYDNENLIGAPVTAIGGTETGNKEYWAKWEINQYTITFDTVGGSTVASITQDYGTAIAAPANPTREGYTFIGWDKEIPSTMPAENVTITAKWVVNQYTITFDTAGGSAVASITQNYGTAITAPADPTREGYTFIGWDKAIPATMPAENMIIKAKWKVNQYTITFDSNGGSEIAPITQDYGTAITAPADPTREGYTFIGWDKAIPATMPAENMIITAKWRDIAVPTGEIKIAENGWKSFLNTITFRLFFKDTQTVTVTAADNSGKAVKIEYLLSDKALSESELAGKTFTAYSAPFSINPDNEYVIYVKLTDTSGNFAYINTNGIVLDATVPGISGIADGKTYCAAQIVTVDEKYIGTVKVNGTEVSLDKNSQFALSPASGKQTIVVTDKAGNETSVTVTVNDGHTYEWQSENGQYWQKCKFCNHETAKKDIPTINISGADKVCRTQDYKFSFTLPEGATGAAYGYKFIGFDDGPLTPTVENGLYSGIIKASAYPAKENSFKLIVSAKTADGFAFSAEKKVTIQNEHTGGTATCKDKAICEVCGESYGKLDLNNHANLKHIDAKAATKTSEGNIEYWYCDGCNKYYKDAKATQEITKAQTVTAKLPPKITAGDGATVTQGEKKELSFTSDASFADFLRVELDGTALDEKNYTKREGSTIITLNRDFVATLSVGEHTLAIVSKSGTATAKFTVKAKPAETATPQPTVTPQPTAQPQPTVQPVSPLPRTGDTANPALWFALLIVSGSALAAIFVLRRKDNRK
jgi:uncharacterized repeat protein (TIGR02543 family)